MICWAPWQLDDSEWEEFVESGTNCVETQNSDTDFTVLSSVICEGGCNNRLVFSLTGVDSIGNFDNSRATTVVEILDYNSKQPIVDENNNITTNNETVLDDEKSDSKKSDSTSSKSGDEESIVLELVLFTIILIIISLLVILIYKQTKNNMQPNQNQNTQFKTALPQQPLPSQAMFTIVPPIRESISTLRQWTDEDGNSWKQMSNGTLLWWNGNSWQEFSEQKSP